MKRPSREELINLWKESEGKPADPNDWIEPPGGAHLPKGMSYVRWTDELRASLEQEFAQVLAPTTGDAIKTAMKTRALTQTALAKRLGVSQPRVGQLTQKGNDLNLETLSAVANAMDYDLELHLVDRKSGKSIVVREKAGGRKREGRS